MKRTDRFMELMTLPDAEREARLDAILDAVGARFQQLLDEEDDAFDDADEITVSTRPAHHAP